MALRYLIFQILACFIIVLAIIMPFSNAQLIIPTKNGLVSGKTIITNDRTQFAYFGIPYAQPPINELRFKPPVPVKSWNGVLNATQCQYTCPQRLPLDFYTEPNSLASKTSEDCLYLNIFTSNPSRAGNMSVLFYIHGGGYRGGSGARWGGQILAAHEDIVVVTINYRIGILGFMTSGEEDIAKRAILANNGLKDQSLALQWVKDNIENFGALTVQQLISLQNIQRPNNIALSFPVADASTIREALHTAIPAGRFHKVSIMMGTTLNDGYFGLLGLPNPGSVAQGIPRQGFIAITNNAFPFASQRVKLSIQYQYTNWSNFNSPISNRDQYGELFNDFVFAIPNEYYAEQFSRYVPTFNYIFAHRTSGTYRPAYLKVVHTMEVPYVFGYPVDNPAGFPTTFNAEEQELSRHIMSYWGSFIRNGNPTDLNSPITWLKYTQDTRQHLWIAPNFRITSNHFATQTAFWNQYLPQIAMQRTHATVTPANRTTPIKPHSSESVYMIPTFVLSGLSGLLLIIAVILFCKMNRAKRVYVN
ncbi:Esterase E4 [Trichoplax sp. H2]|nr:Esterase E4 [Trichoplax sp. H2]|eukprot:RDD37467.1 Esterase E4 [Trichoplax sp. H2]